MVVFDGGGGVFGGGVGVDEVGVGDGWGVVCDPGSDGVVAVVWVADAEDEGVGHGRSPGLWV